MPSCRGCKQRTIRQERTGMTDLYIELSGKKAIAWSLEWPGWCRIRKSEEEAVQALIETEGVYARKIGVRHPPFEVDDKDALRAMREEIAAVLAQPSSGEPLVDGGWNASYAVRRIAWHVVDHIWEIEDRRS